MFLVGAGPGDAGLVTWRGVECLRQADAVLYDYLVNPAILRHAAVNCRLVCLGRHRRHEGSESASGQRIWPQAEINDQLIQLARAGQRVVRLKGGDPAIFGRLAEEVAAMERAGIEYEIVPGITAAQAASGPMLAFGSHRRDVASAVAFVTGHEGDSPDPPWLDYAALAAFPGTLVFYMGVTTARQWTAALISAGKAADTPAAIVRRCSWPDQTTMRCTLGTIASQIEAAHARPPVVFIVGNVAASAGIRGNELVHAAAAVWKTDSARHGRSIEPMRSISRSWNWERSAWCSRRSRSGCRAIGGR